ncbi:MAG TPA: hypothetical protein VFQ48_10405, partial [Pseudonocardiaceae bacterium]|nr:hypothetical protein [Pseudonocardiaceae bacterium]
MTTEYKTITPSGLKMTGERTAELVIGTLGVIDRDGDVVVHGSVGEQTAPLIPAHDWSSVPLGKGVVFERGDLMVA